MPGGKGERGWMPAPGACVTGNASAGAIADRIRRSQVDKKWTELVGLLTDAPEMMEAGRLRWKLIVFAEHRDTLNYLSASCAPTSADPKSSWPFTAE